MTEIALAKVESGESASRLTQHDKGASVRGRENEKQVEHQRHHEDGKYQADLSQLHGFGNLKKEDFKPHDNNILPAGFAGAKDLLPASQQGDASAGKDDSRKQDADRYNASKAPEHRQTPYDDTPPTISIEVPPGTNVRVSPGCTNVKWNQTANGGVLIVSQDGGLPGPPGPCEVTQNRRVPY